MTVYVVRTVNFKDPKLAHHILSVHETRSSADDRVESLQQAAIRSGDRFDYPNRYWFSPEQLDLRVERPKYQPAEVVRGIVAGLES